MEMISNLIILTLLTWEKVTNRHPNIGNKRTLIVHRLWGGWWRRWRGSWWSRHWWGWWGRSYWRRWRRPGRWRRRITRRRCWGWGWGWWRRRCGWVSRRNNRCGRGWKGGRWGWLTQRLFLRRYWGENGLWFNGLWFNWTIHYGNGHGVRGWQSCFAVFSGIFNDNNATKARLLYYAARDSTSRICHPDRTSCGSTTAFSGVSRGENVRIGRCPFVIGSFAYAIRFSVLTVGGDGGGGSRTRNGKINWIAFYISIEYSNFHRSRSKIGGNCNLQCLTIHESCGKIRISW